MYSRLLPTSGRSVLKQRALELDEARQTETSTLPRFTSFSKARRRRRRELRRHCHYKLPPVPLHTQCREQYFNGLCTGKSFSEALILASVNPQYDNRLFIELQLQYEKNTSSEHVVYKYCFKCQNKKKTIFVHNML